MRTGDLRAYKVHLGRRSIFRGPSDHRLGIAPKRGASELGGSGGVLPTFEGDAALAMVLGRAKLRDEGAKIASPMIVSQIRRRVVGHRGARSSRGRRRWVRCAVCLVRG